MKDLGKILTAVLMVACAGRASADYVTIRNTSDLGNLQGGNTYYFPKSLAVPPVPTTNVPPVKFRMEMFKMQDVTGCTTANAMRVWFAPSFVPKGHWCYLESSDRLEEGSFRYHGDGKRWQQQSDNLADAVTGMYSGPDRSCFDLVLPPGEPLRHCRFRIADDMPVRLFRSRILEDGTLAILGFEDGSPDANGALAIAEHIDGRTVTEIGDSAFRGLLNLKTVSLPPTLKAIRSKAFAGCPKLTKPDIPAGCEVAPDAFDQ